MRLLSAFDVFSGCTWYRAIIPAWEAERCGHEVRVRRAELSREDIEWCDTFQVQRLFQPEAYAAIDLANRLGKMTVYDVDDDLWSIGPDNSSQAFWQDHNQYAVHVLRACQRVTTTNPYLADILGKFHPDVRVIPNALPDDFVHIGEHDGLVVGWSGGNSHAGDLRMIEPTLLEVLDARPDFRLELCGDGGWIERATHLKPVEITAYHQLISRFDIGLAPLEDNRFNRAKSDLKPLEYAAIGIPCIASKVGPYKGLPHGDTCYLASNAKDWRKYLLRLIDDERQRRAMGNRAREWASKRTIREVFPRWMKAWQ